MKVSGRVFQESEDVWSSAEVTKQPFTTLFNLQPGQTYRFRVRADNAYGTSEPSEESESVIAYMLQYVVSFCVNMCSQSKTHGLLLCVGVGSLLRSHLM